MNPRERLRHERMALQLEIALARSTAAAAAQDLARDAAAAVLGASVARVLAGRSRFAGVLGAAAGLLLSALARGASARTPPC